MGKRIIRDDALTLRKVANAAKYQATMEDLASIFNCTRQTIVNKMNESPKFREAYQRGKSEGLWSLRSLMFRQALRDNPKYNSIRILEAKNKLGYAERSEITGDGGQPIVSRIEIVAMPTDDSNKNVDRTISKQSKAIEGAVLSRGTSIDTDDFEDVIEIKGE